MNQQQDVPVEESENGTKENLIGHAPEDLAFLQPQDGDIHLNNPKPPQRLEAFSVVCIICNRMIGKCSSGCSIDITRTSNANLVMIQVYRDANTSTSLLGTGIFLTPTRLIQYTHSVGITLLFWLGGGIAALAGILVYMEFGLTTPRYNFEGLGKLSVPRNGGELHYVSTTSRTIGIDRTSTHRLHHSSRI